VPRFVNLRRKTVICILQSVDRSKHELFALRILLRRFPARCWEDLRTHHGQTWSSFAETTYQLVLVTDPNQGAELYIQDAVELGRPPSEIRFLLATMVFYGASRAFLEDRFARDLAEPGDTLDRLHWRLNQLIDRNQFPSLDSDVLSPSIIP
jgi:hypothetical protein